MAAISNEMQHQVASAPTELSRLRPLPAYTHQYSRTINFTDLNMANHLDSAVLCRYIADTLAIFWMDVFELPLGCKQGTTEWLAHVGGYEHQGIPSVFPTNVEQHLRYVGRFARRQSLLSPVI